MEGSILTVHVVEARDLKPMTINGTADPYIVIQVEGQKIESNFKKSTLNPVWNESYTFEIRNGNEKMKLIVMDKDTFGNDEFQGECYIDLDTLRDQMKHDMWYELCEKDRDIIFQGRVRLMLQWVYSKIQYFSEYLTKWDETLVRDCEEKERIEIYLKQMESPFGFLDQMVGELLEDDDDDEPDTAAEKIMKDNDRKLRQ